MKTDIKSIKKDREQIVKIEVNYVDIDSIKPYANNARSHGTEDVKGIIASIKEFGFNDPIGVWKDTIVEGHGRWLAAKELKMELVPVLRLDHLTDEQRKAYGLAHNKTAELSSWDFNMLDAELKDISEIDMSLFGCDMSVVEEDREQQTEEDNEFEDIEKSEKHYGVPYQGNKSRIADIIISLLPAGNRLVDLFGGGVLLRIAQCFRANGRAICITI